MDTKKVTTEYRLSQWSQAFQERKENDETIDEFCNRKGISKNMYFYWQKKLRKAICNEIPEVPQGWATLSVQSPVTEELVVDVGGCRISVNSNTNAELLTNVCRLLKSL